MILLAAALLLQGAPKAEDPVMLMGRTLERISVAVTRGPDGKLKCGLDDLSGDAKIDAGLCKVATKCAKASETASESMEACIARGKASLLEDYASRTRTSR